MIKVCVCGGGGTATTVNAELTGQTGAKCHTTSRLRGIRATDCACLCLVVNTIAVVVSLLDRHKTGSCFVQIDGDNKTTLYVRDT